MSTIGLYSKAIAAAVAAGFTAAITALADGHITGVEWTLIAGAVLVAGGGVFAVPNIPDSVRAYSKAILAALIAGVAALGVALTDGGVSKAELLTIALALLSGGGLVSIVPNALSSDGAEPTYSAHEPS